MTILSLYDQVIHLIAAGETVAIEDGIISVLCVGRVMSAFTNNKRHCDGEVILL